MRHIFSFAILIFGLFLLGCANKTPAFNENPSKNNPISFKEDLTDCKESYPDVASGAEVKQRLACMRAKGWN